MKQKWLRIWDPLRGDLICSHWLLGLSSITFMGHSHKEPGLLMRLGKIIVAHYGEFDFNPWYFTLHLNENFHLKITMLDYYYNYFSLTNFLLLTFIQEKITDLGFIPWSRYRLTNGEYSSVLKRSYCTTWHDLPNNANTTLFTISFSKNFNQCLSHPSEVNHMISSSVR